MQLIVKTKSMCYINNNKSIEIYNLYNCFKLLLYVIHKGKYEKIKKEFQIREHVNFNARSYKWL